VTIICTEHNKNTGRYGNITAFSYLIIHSHSFIEEPV